MKINDGYNVGKKKKGAAVTLITAVLLLAAAAVSVLIGRYSITPDMLWEILFHGDTPLTEEAEAASLVLFETRIARIAAAVLIGASLSAAGAAYQGIFRNPMVSPDILGAATGASFGGGVFFHQLFSYPAVRRSDADAGSDGNGGVGAVFRFHIDHQVCGRSL